MVSIKDVAKRANVSIATVSHTIRGTKPVSEDLQKRIRQAIKELNYQVNPIASGLKGKNTLSIGVVLTNMSRIFFAQMSKGIHDRVAELGYRLIFTDTDDDLDKERDVIGAMCRSWVDGIILASVAPPGDQEYFDFLANLSSGNKHIPIVSVERSLGENRMDCVKVDNHAAAQTVTQHLIDSGCRKLAHITGPANSCLAQDRLLGFQQAIGQGLNDQAAIIAPGDFSPAGGYQAMTDLLERGAKIDGVFAANDQMALGAMQAMRENDLGIPDDIKVVGFDNAFVASIVNPSLTTIHVPKYDMGAQAAELLLQRIENPESEPECIDLPTELIVRQSTDPAGQDQWELAGW